MYKHCKNLYEQPNVVKMECHQTKPSFFTIKYVHHGLEKLATFKAKDVQGLKAKILKWTRVKMHYWICDVFNLVLQYGMAHDWGINWIKPLH